MRPPMRDHPEHAPAMNLDHFTQKAQEAIVAAQQLAERLQSPVLDAEHLLAALVEDDEGIPAQTLRRIGRRTCAGLPGELAGAPRAGAPRSRAASWPSIRGPAASSTARPRRRRRLGDEYVSTEHLLLGIVDVGRRRPGAPGAPRGRARGRCSGALAGIRGSQRVTVAEPRERRTRRWRSTAAT